MQMKKTFIIAEAGVNHNGEIDIAKELIDVAFKAGVDAVKFQSFKADKTVSKNTVKAPYQKHTTNETESQYQMIKKLELSFEDHVELIDHCKQKSIIFLSSPFDIESINLLRRLGLETIKIPSGEITNLPYLRAIGELNKKIILSTGMSDIGEVEDAIDVLVKSGTGKNNIAILHANTEYPTPMEDVNLNAMLTIKQAFSVPVGYSDHTNGIEVPIAAVAVGAEIIEKHFTLDKNLEGPDHKASLNPGELFQMVKAIRNIEKAMGNGLKKPSKSEMANKLIARKSIIAAQDISKGEILTENNLITKRPGNGLSPMLWDHVIGKKATKDYHEDELILI